MSALGVAGGFCRPSFSASPDFRGDDCPDGVALSWSRPGAVKLLRSFLSFKHGWCEDTRHPWTVLARGAQLEPGFFVDQGAAHDIRYFYLLVFDDGTELVTECRTSPSKVPISAIACIQRPKIMVDKAAYTLELWDSKKLLRRFAINMGRLPKVRKLHQDRSSTPEGRYLLGDRYMKHEFHKAIDIDYPNQTDRARYRLMKPGRDIGGEIQIHGEGLGRNFTFGCMALYNHHMDELMTAKCLKGAACWIYGGELTLADLECDLQHAGQHTATEIGDFQLQNGLKVTCIWDSAMREMCGP